jgi:hypothetical protein
MQLEEMKSLWDEMSVAVDKQKTLTDTLIIQMTQVRYRNKLSKIWIPEATAALVCLAGDIAILANVQKLDRWYLLVCAIGTVVILSSMAVLSLSALRRMQSVAISKQDYRQSLLAYSKGKKQFVFVQKLSFYLGVLLMAAVLPVAGKLVGGKDFFTNPSLWWGYAIGLVFFYLFYKWVSRHYNKIVAAAEDILKELEE